MASAEQAFARTDVGVVKPVSLRADIDAGPVTYGEVAEALAFDHPVVRVRMSGRRLRDMIEDGAYVAGPEELEPGRHLQRRGQRADRRRRARRGQRAAGAGLVPCTLSAALVVN